MDINKRVAERRSQLERDRAIEEKKLEQEKAAIRAARVSEEREKRNRERELLELKKLEALEQERLRRARNQEIMELAEEEAKLRIQLIEDRLQDAKKRGQAKLVFAVPDKWSSDEIREIQGIVKLEVEKRVESYISDLASKRIKLWQKALFVGLLFSVVFGFFYAWFIGAALLVSAIYYAANLSALYKKEVESEAGIK